MEAGVDAIMISNHGGTFLLLHSPSSSQNHSRTTDGIVSFVCVPAYFRD